MFKRLSSSRKKAFDSDETSENDKMTPKAEREISIFAYQIYDYEYAASYLAQSCFFLSDQSIVCLTLIIDK